MFLYLLNSKEGEAFMELFTLAAKVSDDRDLVEDATSESYLDELGLNEYVPKGLSLDETASLFMNSDISVRRAVLVELCCYFQSSSDLNESESNWIWSLSDKLQVKNEETERLIKWSKDFSVFLKIGLMYINANEK